MKKLFITILFFLIFPFSAVAWPEKPIKIIAPFSAGNGSDVAARYFAEKLEEKLKLYTNPERNKKYYEKNSDVVKEKAKTYMEKMKETNPEKLKEWRHNAYDRH